MGKMKMRKDRIKKPRKLKNMLTAIFNTAENYKSGITIAAKTHLTA